MADPARARKLAERIQQIVAHLLDTRVKDPRLGFVTVTDVKVTGDLQHASVFYTVLGDEEARAGTAAALESAKGLLRSEVGKRLGIQRVGAAPVRERPRRLLIWVGDQAPAYPEQNTNPLG